MLSTSPVRNADLSTLSDASAAEQWLQERGTGGWSSVGGVVEVRAEAEASNYSFGLESILNPNSSDWVQDERVIRYPML